MVERTNEKGRTAERRWAILQGVERDQEVSVARLSDQFGISEISIRRDLEHLEEMGLIQRVRGGARALARADQSSAFDARLLQHTPIKQAIGQAAAQLIGLRDIILLDSGTTVLEIARALPRTLIEGGGLTLVTRSLVIASELRLYRQIRLILLGGVYVPAFDDFVGPQVEHALTNLHVNTLFIGTDGVDAEHGLTTDNVLEAGLFRIMAGCADRVVVATDSTKIGRIRLQSILSVQDIDTFITDSNAPDHFVQALRDRGIEVIVVPAV